MWINEAQIELIAMTSHNSTAAKWEYVEGPPESRRLFGFQGGEVKKEKSSQLTFTLNLLKDGQNGGVVETFHLSLIIP